MTVQRSDCVWVQDRGISLTGHCDFTSLNGGPQSVEVTVCCEESQGIATRCQISKSILILIPSVEFTLLSGPHMTSDIKICSL